MVDMKVQKQQSMAVRMAEAVIKRHSAAQIIWNYESGLVLSALLAVGAATGESRYFRFVKGYMDALVGADGTIRGYRLEEYSLDQINAGKVLFDLYARTGEERYRAALMTLRSQFLTQPRTLSGGYWHKKIYPHQVWLDGLYMQGPFLARYAREFREPEIFDDICHELALIEEKARDERTGLLYHAWDESKTQLWSDPETGCSPHFWGRALGWYAMALVDVLDYLPQDHPGRAGLVASGKRLGEAIAKVQDQETGLWHQILNQPLRNGNYLESSASSMFVFFFAKSIREGYLPADAFVEPARRGYEGLMREKIRLGPDGEAHLEGICRVAGLGGNPYRDGSFEYYTSEPVVRDDYKGLGPFILASLEIEHLSEGSRA